MHVRKSVTIMRQPVQVYSFWRAFENLPRFMQHLEDVEIVNDRRSRWTAKAPGGGVVEWTAEVTQDVPNQLIAWHSLPESEIRTSGTVRFRQAPADRGTELTVELNYDAPAGALGTAVAKMFGEEP